MNETKTTTVNRFIVKKLSSKCFAVVELATGKEKGKFTSGPSSSALPRAQAMADRLNAAAQDGAASK